MFIVGLIVVVITIIIINKQYLKCSYHQVTKNSLLQVWLDKGRLGEYMTYKYLQSAERNGAKFLFNLYIPKNEDETTEIDVLMIHPKGLFVFESKNYSGWIFGSEYQKNWYQTLPRGKGRSHKEAFYNPIMQNRSHIKHLRALLAKDIPMHSIIVFSERCTIRKMELKSRDISVINRNQVYDVVAAICAKTEEAVLSNAQIAEIYDQLYPYTQVDAALKEQHIKNIESKNESVAELTQGKIQSIEEEAVQEKPAQEMICPRCGSALVMRTAARGANAGNQFYGCSNYPKCRFMQNITKEEEQT